MAASTPGKPTVRRRMAAEKGISAGELIAYALVVSESRSLVSNLPILAVNEAVHPEHYEAAIVELNPPIHFLPCERVRFVLNLPIWVWIEKVYPRYC